MASNFKVFKKDMGVKIFAEGQSDGIGFITQVEPGKNGRDDRLEIQLQKPSQRLMWFAYVTNNNLLEGWRFSQPDPMQSRLMTYCHKGPIFTIEPQI